MAKTIRLTESDLTRIVKKVVNEQRTKDLNVKSSNFLDQLIGMGRVKKSSSLPDTIYITDRNGKNWVISKEWVYNESGTKDQPQFVDEDGKGKVSQNFINLFDNRRSFIGGRGF